MEINTLNQRWFLLLVAAAFLAMFINGLRTKNATLIYASYKKSEHPTLYWVSVGTSGVGFVAMLCLAIWPKLGT